MKRRDMLRSTGAALVGLSACPARWLFGAENKRPTILYFTRSVEYEHSVVHRKDGQLSHSEKILTELGNKAGLDVVCSKDGTIFDGSLDKYDGLVFYTCANLTLPSIDKAPPMSADGKKRLVDAVAAGKPFVAVHSACYWGRNTPSDDPYLKMVGANFIVHGAPQESTMLVTAPEFPGVKGLGKSFRMVDEWYALKDFADNLHVVLAEDSTGMKGPMYQRPPFPSTWARKHGDGRVFFTAMGHREDVWTNPVFQGVLMGGITWALGRAEAAIPPNIRKVTPRAEEYPK